MAKYNTQKIRSFLFSCRHRIIVVRLANHKLDVRLFVFLPKNYIVLMLMLECSITSQCSNKMCQHNEEKLTQKPIAVLYRGRRREKYLHWKILQSILAVVITEDTM